MLEVGRWAATNALCSIEPMACRGLVSVWKRGPNWVNAVARCRTAQDSNQCVGVLQQLERPHFPGSPLRRQFVKL